MYPGYSIWLGSLPINEIRFAVYELCDKPLFMKLCKRNNIDHVNYCSFSFVCRVIYGRSELKPLKANLMKTEYHGG